MPYVTTFLSNSPHSNIHTPQHTITMANVKFLIRFTDGNSNYVHNILHIVTSNTSNGDSRALILPLDEYGHVLAVIHAGVTWGDLDSFNREFAQWSRLHSVRINVSPTEFKRWACMTPGELESITTITN
jgi:hypothetical protein